VARAIVPTSIIAHLGCVPPKSTSIGVSDANNCSYESSSDSFSLSLGSSESKVKGRLEIQAAFCYSQVELVIIYNFDNLLARLEIEGVL
jgi:hypothetical protein